MRQHTDELVDVLSGSFTRRLFVNVYHGSQRVEENLEFESWSLEGNLDAKVSVSGSGTVVYLSESGETVAPEGTRGVLSPFRARLELVMEVTAGDFIERVSLGLFRVVSVPETRDFFVDDDGVSRVYASRVKVSFRSLEEDDRRRGFRSPESPVYPASCYAEFRRLTSLPVMETVPDAPIQGNPVWEAKQGGRLDALQKLANQLGGVAVVNSSNAWVVVPDVVGDPVGVLQIGAQGTVLDVGNEVDTDDVYNVVVGQFEDDDRNPFYAVAEVESGDLAPGSAYRENTRYYSSEFVKTPLQGQEAVESILALSTGSQQYNVPIQCHINPLVELGDVLELQGWVRPLVGRLVRFSMSDSAYMNVTLEVHRKL